MATLKCLSSGSQGNCYLLEIKEETLILELGIGWKDVLKGLNYNLSKVIGCLSTHSHLDHSKSIPNAIKNALDVYSCKEVQTIHPQVKMLKKGSKYKIGGFLVQPIPVPHSVECYSYVIDHEDIGRSLFITDTSDFKYKVKGCKHIFIEANWSEEILIDNACNDVEMRSRHEQHLEINQTIDILKANYSSELETIVLLHLSNGNADAKKFQSMVQYELGFKNVHIAESGLVVNLESDF